MGMLSKSKRNEEGPLTLNLDDLDFSISFDKLEKKIKLNDNSMILLEKAIKGNHKLTRDKKTIKAGRFKVDSDDEWNYAFDKLLEYNMIIKNDFDYGVTSKGIDYYNNID